MDAASEHQSIRKDTAYVYGAYALRYLSVIILVPYYGRILGPAAYGTVLTAMSLMGLVWLTVNYGFSTTGARELASNADSKFKAEVIGRQTSARLILLPVGILIGIIGAIASPELRANPWFAVVATALGLVNAMNLGWFYQGLRRFKLSLLFEAMAYPLNVLFVLIFVKAPNDGLQALASLLASSAIAGTCAYVVALRLVKPNALSFIKGFAEIRSASTIFLQSVNSTVMTSGSTYLLSIFSTPQQVGYFGSVEKLIAFALAFLQPAAQVLMPTIAYRAARAQQDSNRLVSTGIALETGYGVCACVVGALFASQIIGLAFGPKFGQSVPIMQMMVFALPFAALTHSIGSYVMIPRRKERWLVIAYGTGNFFNLLIVVIVAKPFGGIGVSVARIAGEVITISVLLLVLFKNRFRGV